MTPLTFLLIVLSFFCSGMAPASRKPPVTKPPAAVKADTTPPVISINPVKSPTNQNVTLSYAVNDDVSPAGKITVTGDGSPYTKEGVYNVTLTAKDQAGNISTVQVSFTIDKTPPQILITSPGNGASVEEAIIRLEGTIGGIPFSEAVSLSEGENILTKTATDAAGNTASASVKVRLSLSPAGDPIDYFVDANYGSDSNDGALSTPFKTIQKARDTIRELKKEGKFRVPVNVYLKEGVYELKTPFELTVEDSGTAGKPITYQSYSRNARAVISGGRSIKGWAREGRFLVVNVGSLRFNSFFVTGRRAIRSRIPNESEAQPYYKVAGSGSDNRTAFNFNPNNISPVWRNANDVEVVPSGLYFQMRFKIKAVDPKARKVYLSGKALPYPYGAAYDKMDRYYVENVFEGLDSPGEWYLDRTSGKLYYYPLPGEDENSEFIAPVLKQLVRAGDYAKYKEAVDHDYMEIPEDADFRFGTGSFSISLWLSDNATQASGWCLSKIEPRDNQGHYGPGYGIYINRPSSTANPEVRLLLSDGASQIESSAGVLTPGKWRHFVWVVDRALLQRQVRAYANGNLISVQKISNLKDIASLVSFYVGLMNCSYPSAFRGGVDELKIFNTALSQNDVQNLYKSNSAVNKYPLLSLSFEQNFDDISGCGNLPRVFGNPKFIEGPFGKALSFAGRPLGNPFSDYVTNVNFKDLVFSYSDWDMPKQGYASYQSDYFLEQPAIMLITKDSAFEDNVVNHTGGCAIESYSNNLSIKRNEIFDTGAGAVRVGQIGKMYNSVLVSAAGFHQIEDNKFYDTGSVYKGSVAVSIYHSGNNSVSHNLIHDSPYSGINVGWWTPVYWHTFFGDNKIEYNEIYNNLKYLNDGGGIYVLGKQPGSEIKNNIIHDVGFTKNHANQKYLFGLYFDHAEDILAMNNLVYNIGESGVIFCDLHYKEAVPVYIDRNIVKNNIFVNSMNYQTYFDSPNDTFTNNIIYYSINKLSQVFYSPTVKRVKISNYNLFYTPGTVALYRLYNKKTQARFYTIDEAEKNKFLAQYAGISETEKPAGYVYAKPYPETVPFYRLHNKNNQDYFYTVSETERNKLLVGYSDIFIDDGIAAYVYNKQQPSTVPLYRLYNTKNNCHFYTINEPEMAQFLSTKDWSVEGIVCYVYAEPFLDKLKPQLDAWKRFGFDKDSAIRDPLFINYKDDNFALAPGSPALASPITFQPLDLRDVGPRD